MFELLFLGAPEIEDHAARIKHAVHSACGEDGIPYFAWRRLGKFGAECLFQVTKALMHEQGVDQLKEAYRDEEGVVEGGHNFKTSLLCSLPKKVSGRDDEKGEFYDPGNSRPLSIVNMDNRLMPTR